MDYSLSVIVPVYNREKTILRCLMSVINQIYPVYEIIVVDDGSTDKSKDIITELQLKYRKINYIYKANGGAASARNEGLKIATGEWLLFLDSDDIWIPEKTNNIITEINLYPGVDFIHTNRSHRKDNCEDEVRVAESYMMQNKELLYKHFLIKTSTVAIKRLLLQKLDYWFDETLHTCEDFEFFWRIVYYAESIRYIPSADTIIYLGADGISRKIRYDNLILDNLSAMNKFQIWLLHSGDKNEWIVNIMQERKYWQHVILFRYLISNLNTVKSIKYFYKAINNLGLIRATRALASSLIKIFSSDY